jgi:hypothetical protein
MPSTPRKSAPLTAIYPAGMQSAGTIAIFSTGMEIRMRRAIMTVLLAALGVTLAACAVPYDNNVPYSGYVYPDDYYMPGYGGVVWDEGGGWHYHWHDWSHHADAGHWSGGHGGHGHRG